MRTTNDLPREPRQRKRGRGRTWLIVGGIVFFVVGTSLRGIAGFYTDYLWFDSLGYGGVWSGVLGAKVALSVIFTGIFFIAMWANLFIADKLAPRFRPAGPEEEMIERFEELVGNRTGMLRVVVSLLFAIIAGAGASSEWDSWILFTNGGDFGIDDPQFGTDVGFYVFKLPFLSYVAGWSFAALLIVFIVTAVAHYLNGGIRVQAPGPRVTSQVKAHLSVLLGLLALVRAGGYWLERYELTVSTRGTVDGATYTDVNAQLPAIQLLLLISIASFALFIVNIWRRGWVLPVLGVGLWALVALVASGIYPQVVQRFQVKPSESAKEAPFIARNIEATRFAVGLDGVESVPFDLATDVESVDLKANAETIRNIRLWDPNKDILGKTFQQEQATRDFYKITDVDVDRYVIDGQLTQVMLGVRDLNTDGVPQSSWEARHLTFTHGQGVVVASATEKASNDGPSYFVQDIPARVSRDGLEITRPQVYFGENLDDYVITGTKRAELDFQADEETIFSRYEGTDGVEVGSFLRKAAFSLRFGDYNPLISDFIDDDSKIHYIRDVHDRAKQLAPFLHFDADPYPVVLDGRIVYVLDAYTTSDRFPYGQRAVNTQLPAGSDLDHRFNYVRNSVKAVVDAYDGSVDFYVMPTDDPIIKAYRKAFPELFDDFADMPEELKSHLRYPEDLFRVQTNMWARYHLSNPEDFYNNNDAWAVSPDPQSAGAAQATTSSSTGGASQPASPSSSTVRIDPYYLLLALPGSADLEFAITRPFVPFSEGDDRPQLTALMFGSSDPDSYGKLQVFVMPASNPPDGPARVNGDIQSDPSVSELETLLGNEGSSVLRGNLLVLPVDNSLLYVRPFYVESEATQIPELRKVIVAFQGQVAIENTLQEALTALFGEAPETGEVIDPPAEGEPDPDLPELSDDEQVDKLLGEALELFADAQAALSEGDLGTYQSKNEAAEKKVKEASDLRQPATADAGGEDDGEGGGAGGTTTTTEPDSA